ncbi:UNVERIFIED_CONTAM: hypothetical protein Slati_0480200 [Sesamum latifolium]|uniref:Uncharacterized protein n=1 Tax=Sesamum latifolium TaxID=2727402 RepID=A0AAW2XX10_9LAMI
MGLGVGLTTPFPPLFQVNFQPSTLLRIHPKERVLLQKICDDPSEVTSRRAGSGSSEYTSGQRWSLRQATTAACRLQDESSDEEEEVGGGMRKRVLLERRRGK